MGKVNIAEILKYCQKGTKLYSPLCGECELDLIKGEWINVYKRNPERYITFNHLGQHSSYSNTDAECILFPSKENRDWDKFQIPFKDGDVLYIDCTDECDDKQHDYIFILNEIYNGKVISYCHYYIPDDEFQIRDLSAPCLTDAKYPIRLATKEEKQKLFDAIKANGSKWNAETKTLEKLIKPKFKVGNKIEKCGYRFTIAEVKDDYYLTKCGNLIAIANQDDFSLVHNKFDVTTLKPFSEVLVRQNVYGKWEIDFFGYYNRGDHHTTGACIFKQCIPFAGNEYLLGTANDCDEFYKTWE